MDTVEAIALREAPLSVLSFCRDDAYHHLMSYCPPCGYEDGAIGPPPEPARSVLFAGPVSARRWQPMTDDQAVAEVGWVARRARELAHGRDIDDAEWVEFYDRKAALLRHLGDPELAVIAAEQAVRYQRAAVL